MHHSSEDHAKRQPDEVPEALKALTDKLGLGATGDYPQGRLTATDEGALRLGVTVQSGKVVIAFGKPIAWLGLDPKQARQLAESIRKRSYEAEGK